MIKLFLNIKKEKIEIDLSTKNYEDRIDLAERLNAKYFEIMKAILSTGNNNDIQVELIINGNKYLKEIKEKNITFFIKQETDSKDILKKIADIFLERQHYEIIIDLNSPFNEEIDITKILKHDGTYVENIENFVMNEHRNINLRKKRGYKDILCNEKIILLYEDIGA